MTARGQNVAHRLLRGLFACETAVLLAAFGVLVFVMFADVLLRRITGSGLLWSRDVGIYANIWLSMIGIGIASAQGAHLRPKFMDGWVPTAWLRWLPRLQELLTAVGFLSLAAIAWLVVAETRELDDRNMVLRWPVWVVQLCLPTAFLFAATKHAVFAIYPQLRPGERDEAGLRPP